MKRAGALFRSSAEKPVPVNGARTSTEPSLRWNQSLHDRSEDAVRATIEALIRAGTTSDLGALDRIYHRDMKVLMIDTEGNLSNFDKPAFVDMLAATVREAGRPASRWARYNAIQANGDHAHVLITRKAHLGGADKVLVLSIDLVHQEDRWQVTREVIFVRPIPDGSPY